jgi:hypothetical protein
MIPVAQITISFGSQEKGADTVAILSLLVSALSLLCTIIVSRVLHKVGKRLTESRSARDYVIGLLREMHQSMTAINRLYGEASFTKQPITPALDLEIRHAFASLRQSLIRAVDAIILLDDVGAEMLCRALMKSFKEYRAATFDDLIGHTKSFDLTAAKVYVQNQNAADISHMVSRAIFCVNTQDDGVRQSILPFA